MTVTSANPNQPAVITETSDFAFTSAVWFNANTGGNENSSNGGIYISSVDGAIVEHCTAIGNCFDSAGSCGIWAFYSKLVTFEYEESTGTQTDKLSWDGNGFDFDFNVSDSLMQYDYAGGNAGTGFYICTYSGANDTANTIRYCVSDDNSNCGDPGILLYSSGAHPVLDALIYNNTVLCDGNAGSEGIGVTGPGGAITTVSFLDNIVCGVNNALLVDCTDFTPVWSNFLFEGNDYWDAGPNHFSAYGGSTTYSSMKSWISATGEETISHATVGMNIDPQLVNETASDIPIAEITNVELSAASALAGSALDLTMPPFSSASPYTSNAPFNLGGRQWNGLGTQDYFGFDVDPSNESVGANTTDNLTVVSGVETAPSGVSGNVATTTFSNVSISAGAELVAADSSGGLLKIVTGSLALAGTTNAWTGTLDLGSDDLIVRNGNLAAITNQISQGYNNNWQPGGGIISSAAASDTTHLTTLGVIQNSTTGDPDGPALYTSFDSSPAYSTDVLVKYTYFGDANLDGVVDGSDYSRIDNGCLEGLTGWSNGDFNYDGVIDGSDYTLLDNAYNTQGPSLAAEAATAMAIPTAQLG